MPPGDMLKLQSNSTKAHLITARNSQVLSKVPSSQPEIELKNLGQKGELERERQ